MDALSLFVLICSLRKQTGRWWGWICYCLLSYT